MPRCAIPDKAVARSKIRHAGLWLDKYLYDFDTASRGQFAHEVAQIAEPPGYSSYYKRWCATLQSAGGSMRMATVQGRLAIGLGSASLIENAITLHRVYGVPYIPGSSLKGLASSYARQKLGADWHAPSPAYRTVFGYGPEKQAQEDEADQEGTDDGTDTGSAAGFVTFFDALYLPGSGHQGKPLHPDILTVHHQGYYNAPGSGAPPADWDDPVPAPFLTATGKYLMALGGPEAWVDAAFHILAHALADYGVGGKTNAGYGRMQVEGLEALAAIHAAGSGGGVPKQVDPDEIWLNHFLGRLEALSNSQVAGQIHGFYQQWKARDLSPELSRRACQAIVEKVRSANREKKSKGRDWYQELLACAESEQ